MYFKCLKSSFCCTFRKRMIRRDYNLLCSVFQLKFTATKRRVIIANDNMRYKTIIWRQNDIRKQSIIVFDFISFILKSLTISKMECVPLTISYDLYFYSLENVTSRIGQVQKMEFNFMFSCAFLTFCSCFSSEFFFLTFSFLFTQSIKFLLQNINRSKTRMCDEKVSVELYECVF